MVDMPRELTFKINIEGMDPDQVQRAAAVKIAEQSLRRVDPTPEYAVANYNVPGDVSDIVDLARWIYDGSHPLDRYTNEVEKVD